MLQELQMKAYVTSAQIEGVGEGLMMNSRGNLKITPRQQKINRTLQGKAP